ncbi:type II toxin-antitoxin system VapC family toxin [Sphingomonas lacunae]|uniref:Type II toxin-antitoxin system VapC family toxin n=2 Tax=Sphingomonas lacunae TaxID=2698828 RepID=A0A6M4B2R4_9SPHN|nr:type II toxin-antitoxin system VapC family toxin [Sphingomonas lacunae]
MLDANCAIYAMIDASCAISQRIAGLSPGDIVMSAVSFSEVALGTQNQRPPPPEVLDAFVEAVPILPFDEAAARVYARLPFKHAHFDRLLAAHALSLGAIVVTTNEADLADVPGLVVENWAV